MKNIALSSRLQCFYDAAADVVQRTGAGPLTLCDVGCDHAHVPLKLLNDGIIRYAYCLDVIPGPLKIARENVDRFGLTDKVDIVLSDGLSSFDGSADILMITGMGGKMIVDILDRDIDKTVLFPVLILSPQSFHELVRKCLRSIGYGITEESMIEENGKFYPVIIARYGSAGSTPVWRYSEAGPDRAYDEELRQYAEDLYGPILIAKKDPVLHRYLLRGLEKTGAVLTTLGDGDKKDQFTKQLACIRSILKEYGDQYETL